ncbi:uncharacterized protein MELLADRAFT_113917 [Melampsora larici-populina 98AG31]|uniref:Tet-like 2OG-Fe(II) oxygenase domain-containing protein n=1 Tax=Melampsora larici-populina (strain 98AG31 / pathotype 3-4-7) TaxID=747676 RepID=F4SBH3_MELLP|nr:uncharacterized protein MELLADRAFT_113917 [Melampsora larici-populina 98AG31]EGF98005.1 hypothetical protein MELLADRAFT_113917 [Melampsora larici-populina 98AG31]
MFQSKLLELEFISTYLRNERKHSNPVKSNCAMLRGYMGAVGYCKAYYTGEIGGGYCPFKRNRALLEISPLQVTHSPVSRIKTTILPDGLMVFFSIYKKTGELALKGCDIKGGEFWWPDLNCEVNFSTCNRITEILWRGSKDLHCTRECFEPSGEFTRIGTAVQINIKYERMGVSMGGSIQSYKNQVPLPWELKCYKTLNIPSPKYFGSALFLYRMYLSKIKAQETLDRLKKKQFSCKRKTLRGVMRSFLEPKQSLCSSSEFERQNVMEVKEIEEAITPSKSHF